MDNETNTKVSKNKKGLRIFIVILILILVGLGIAYYFVKIQPVNVDTEVGEQEKQEEQEETTRPKLPEVKVLETFESGVANIGFVFSQKDLDELNAEIPDEVITDFRLIKKGVYRIELIEGVYARISIDRGDGAPSDIYSLTNIDGNKYTTVNEVIFTETFGDGVSIDKEVIPEDLKGRENNIKVRFSLLDKPITDVTENTGKEYKLTASVGGKKYVVGQDIEEGIYDITVDDNSYPQVKFQLIDVHSVPKILSFFAPKPIRKNIELKTGETIEVSLPILRNNRPEEEIQELINKTKTVIFTKNETLTM